MPCVEKMRVVDSSHFSQQRDEFGKVLETRPLLVDAIDGCFHNDKMSGRVHCGWGGLHRVNQIVRRCSARTALLKTRGPIRRCSYNGSDQNDPTVLPPSGLAED